MSTTVRLGVSLSTADLGGASVWLANLPAGYGYRYWVDGNGDNQLFLFQDASGNYFAQLAPLS